MDSDEDPDRAKFLAGVRAKFDAELGGAPPAPLPRLPLLPPDDPTVPWAPSVADVAMLRGWRISPE